MYTLNDIRKVDSEIADAITVTVEQTLNDLQIYSTKDLNSDILLSHQGIN